jgi:hypothetical protein
MVKTHTNRHRWKEWVDPTQLKAMEEAREDLKVVWEADRKYPKSYPMNTGDVLFEVARRLVRRPAEGRKPVKRPLPKPGPPPKHLSDLIDEELVRAVYEHQNADSYKEALRDASQGGRYGSTAFHKILRCVMPAYMIAVYGVDLPRPKVHVLHRGLLEIAEQLIIEEPDGIVEFLDDVCPCGKTHSHEALRKLMDRVRSQK